MRVKLLGSIRYKVDNSLLQIMTKVTIWGEGKKMAISGAEGNFDFFYHGNEDWHFDSGGKIFSLY